MNLRKYHNLIRSLSDDPVQWTALTPYQPGDAILVAVSPIDYQHRFTPNWKGPFKVIRAPNHFQVVYDLGSEECTVHVNNVKRYTGW